MAKDAILWKRDEHTKAKHILLEKFFTKWVSIHSSFFARQGTGVVRIYDGFAGPGVYEDGASGSPLILMRALCTNPRLRSAWGSVRYELHFVEKHRGRAHMLESKLQEFEVAMRERGPGWSENVEWSVTCGLYEENVPGPTPPPSALFLFLDPFGYSHAPMTLTQNLVQQPKSDTLIFLPLSFVHRFADREGQDLALDRFFGTPRWREVEDGPTRPKTLLDLFEQQLRRAGLDHVGSFRLKPDSTNEYFIVGGSGHERGWASIKEGFWAVDPVNGCEYLSPKKPSPGQQSFEFAKPEKSEPNTAPLLGLLRTRFGDRPFSVEQAAEVTARSRFLDTHLRRATLVPAEKEGVLKVERPPGARQFKEGKGIMMHFV